MTLTEPESTVADAPSRVFPVVPVLAGALVLSLVAVGVLAVTASGDPGRIAAAACQSSLLSIADDSADFELTGSMTVRSLTDFAISSDAVRFDNDGQGSGSIDLSSDAEVADLVAFYEARDAREAADGLRSLVVTGPSSGNGTEQNVSCLVTLRGSDVVGQPGIWVDMF